MATECYTQLGFGFQPKLVADFAAGTLTITAAREAIVDFTAPMRKDLREVIVTGPGTPVGASLDELADASDVLGPVVDDPLQQRAGTVQCDLNLGILREQVQNLE